MKCQKIYIINYGMLSGAIMTNEHVFVFMLFYKLTLKQQHTHILTQLKSVNIKRKKI